MPSPAYKFECQEKGKCRQRIGQWLPEGWSDMVFNYKRTAPENLEGEFGTVLYLNCTGGYMC